MGCSSKISIVSTNLIILSKSFSVLLYASFFFNFPILAKIKSRLTTCWKSSILQESYFSSNSTSSMFFDSKSSMSKFSKEIFAISSFGIYFWANLGKMFLLGNKTN